MTDDIPTCESCGHPHVTRYGHQACTGHVIRDRDQYVKGQDRPLLDKPRACQRPALRGLATCHLHGSATPKAVAVGRARDAERRTEELARKLIPDAADRTIIVNPLERLLELASEADEFRESLRIFANRISADEIRYRGTGAGAEQLRAEVTMYRQSLKDTTDMLVAIAKLDIEKMLARIESRKVDMVIDAMTAGLNDAGLDSDQKRAVMAGVARHLRSVRRPAA